MQRKSHLSNRTQRRAAERAALKDARKSAPQFVSTQVLKALTARASGDPGDLDSNPPDLTQPDFVDEVQTTQNPTVETEPEITHKSTGPHTSEGKQISSRNAIRHGLCAIKTLILPNESFSDYIQLEARWMETYRIHPHGDPDPVKAEIARTAARAEWFYLRAERNYSDTEAKLLIENPDMSTWTDDQHKQLSRVLRYRTANGNILNKHRKELEAHVKARNAEAAFYQGMTHRDEKMAIARERLEVFRAKNKPFDLAEELEAMKEKAIRLGFRSPDPEPAAAESDSKL